MEPRKIKLGEAAGYRICVQGRLEPNRSDYLQGMTIETLADESGGAVSVLTGELRDQAALAGVLATLYDWGLPLLSLQRGSA